MKVHLGQSIVVALFVGWDMLDNTVLFELMDTAARRVMDPKTGFKLLEP